MPNQLSPNTPAGDWKRIVFRTGRGLGDAVLCEPLVRAIAASCPAAQLTLVMPAYCRGIERLNFPGDRFEPWLESEPFGVFAQGFDLAIDADPAEYCKDFQSALPPGGTLVRLFAHYRAEADRTTAFERMAEGLARIGIDALGEVPSLALSQAARCEAADALSGLALRGDAPLFVIHPGSNHEYAFKRWAPEGFAFIADEFLTRYDANVVIVGSGKEHELIDYIVSTMRHGGRAKRAFDWTLCQLAALLDACTLFVGNDSGVGHLAAALGRPTVTVVGPTGAHFWGPMTDRALVTDIQGCCYDPSSCGIRCLRSIRGCEVLGAAEALLTATTRRKSHPCLDPIHVADNLSVETAGDDEAILCNSLWNMPMTVQRGRDYVMSVLETVAACGSARRVLERHPEAAPLLEQCLRHGIIMPRHTTKEIAHSAQRHE